MCFHHEVPPNIEFKRSLTTIPTIIMKQDEVLDTTMTQHIRTESLFMFKLSLALSYELAKAY